MHGLWNVINFTYNGLVVLVYPKCMRKQRIEGFRQGIVTRHATEQSSVEACPIKVLLLRCSDMHCLVQLIEHRPAMLHCGAEEKLLNYRVEHTMRSGD